MALTAYTSISVHDAGRKGSFGGAAHRISYLSVEHTKPKMGSSKASSRDETKPCLLHYYRILIPTRSPSSGTGIPAVESASCTSAAEHIFRLE